DRREPTTPLWKEELIRFYLEQSGMINLQTKRGCPYDCLYCTYPGLEGHQFRPWEPRAVVDDITRVQRDYGVSRIFFTDSVFNDGAGHYLQLAEELLRRESQVRWSGFFRPQGIGYRELKLLKRSGLYAMEVGTDAASNTPLAALDKRFTFADVMAFHQAALRLEIPSAHFIMFGGPEETMETVKEGLENIAKLQNCVVFAFAGIRILPGTRLHTRAVREGVLPEEASLLKPVYYFSPALEPAKMNNTIKCAFHGRRDRIFPPAEGQIRMATMNRFGYRGLLWDKLIAFPREKANPSRSGQKARAVQAPL
ncbi:MAG: radical SAM protein, partial [Desulfobacterales bacterium]